MIRSRHSISTNEPIKTNSSAPPGFLPSLRIKVEPLNPVNNSNDNNNNNDDDYDVLLDTNPSNINRSNSNQHNRNNNHSINVNNIFSDARRSASHNNSEIRVEPKFSDKIKKRYENFIGSFDFSGFYKYPISINALLQELFPIYFLITIYVVFITITISDWFYKLSPFYMGATVVIPLFLLIFVWRLYIFIGDGYTYVTNCYCSAVTLLKNKQLGVASCNVNMIVTIVRLNITIGMFRMLYLIMFTKDSYTKVLLKGSFALFYILYWLFYTFGILIKLLATKVWHDDPSK
jgi:hypothetical protein